MTSEPKRKTTKPAPVDDANGSVAVEDGARPRRMLSEKQVLAIVAVGRSTLWRMEKAGNFPRSSYISTNRRVWFEDEVVRWQSEVNGRRKGHGEACVTDRIGVGMIGAERHLI